MPHFKKGSKPSNAFAAAQRAGAEEAMARLRNKIKLPPVPAGTNYRELITRRKEDRAVDDDPLWQATRSVLEPTATVAESSPQCPEHKPDA